MILLSVSLETTLQFFKGYVIDSSAGLNNQSSIVRDLFVFCIMIASEILFTALADYNRNKFIYMNRDRIKKVVVRQNEELFIDSLYFNLTFKKKYLRKSKKMFKRTKLSLCR